jgi:hypothetical protein
MNIGADALMPSRRSWKTCPISWIKSSSTNPTANFQPQIRAYAAIETSIVADVVKILIFGSRNSSALSFAPNLSRISPSAASRPPKRFQAGLR